MFTVGLNSREDATERLFELNHEGDFLLNKSNSCINNFHICYKNKCKTSNPPNINILNLHWFNKCNRACTPIQKLFFFCALVFMFGWILLLDTHSVITDLEHFGKEEQQQVSPGLTVTLWCQGQEIRHSITAHTDARREQENDKKACFILLFKKRTHCLLYSKTRAVKHCDKLK